MSKKDFNNFRFEGLKHRQKSNKYVTMERVSEDEKKIVVKVDDSHLQPTAYGFALILDTHHVVFVKDWQVSQNYYGNEVLINEEFWNVKEWGEFDNFAEAKEELEFKTWLEVAKEQNQRNDDGERINPVMWESHGKVC